jgi:uncharacterized protein
MPIQGHPGVRAKPRTARDNMQERIMSDDHEILSNVPSPCVRNCCLDVDDVCLGCYRSLSEIVGWTAATDREKTATLMRCRSRYIERYAKRTGNR